MSAPRLEWALADALEQSGCSVCRIVRDADGAQKLQASDGLCFDHLGLASDLHDLGADRLRTRAEARLREVRDALQGFWESFDYRKGDPGERDAAASTTAFRLLRDDPGRAT